MIASHCNDCGHTLETSGTDVGQSVPCPKCGRPVTVEDVSQLSSTRISGPDTNPNPTVGFKPEVQSNEFTFLSPPEGPGEIGFLAHYRVLKLLGQGGMGMVFEAVDIHLQRQVALKVIRPELSKDPDFRQRFLREARSTAAVKSDHIVTIHQVGQHNDIPFLAMEFLDGKPLDVWMAEHGRLEIDQVLHLGIQIADGLAAAHERGLVHRDIKPANIWIESPSGRVRILDFGLARPTDEQTRLTQTGFIMGTPEYMAPEQADGKTVDARCDLFSLGCVLYEVASGTQPFDGPSVMAVLKAVALKEPPPLRSICPKVPVELEKLVSQLLAKNPLDRPNSAREVVDRLRQMAGLGTSAAGGCFTPVRPRIGRRLLLVCLGGLLLVCGFATWHFLGSTNRPTFQGVSNDEVLLGMSGPFSGPARELGREMEIGINTYLRAINDQGGVARREVRLVALDDGYEPERTLANMKELNAQRKIFAIIGNVGTPTAQMAVPYTLEQKLIFFGAFTGAPVLRNDPPDRYIFNFRASYEEETAAIVGHLIDIRKILPEQIAVFAQEDGYGDAGFRGVQRVLRKHGRNPEQILRVGYPRNTVEVTAAVQEFLKHPEIRAVVMIPTYRPAARFIQQVKDVRKDMVFTNVSFVGSEALAEELMQMGPQYAEGVIITQVVPHPNSQASLVLKYREHLRQYYPSEKPTFTSLEGYVAASLFLEGMRRAGDQLTTDTLIDAFESIHDLDLGLGARLSFSPSDHQASHKVWATVLDRAGRYKVLDLEN